jgi:multisubunit Na+/H+ antiporter MnhG subunit
LSMHSAVGLFRHRDVVKPWAGQTVSQFGSQIALLAIPLAALHDALTIGLLYAVVYQPFLPALVGCATGGGEQQTGGQPLRRADRRAAHRGRAGAIDPRAATANSLKRHWRGGAGCHHAPLAPGDCGLRLHVESRREPPLSGRCSSPSPNARRPSRSHRSSSRSS